jgi:putative methionine-R-sulfoxide reductase with GAF domain
VTPPAKRDAYRGIIAAIDRMVNRGDEANRLLRTVVNLLYERLEHVAWAGISVLGRGELALGPSRGAPTGGSAIAVAIDYDGRKVGEIALESDEADAFGEDDRIALRRIATLISQHAMVATS